MPKPDPSWDEGTQTLGVETSAGTGGAEGIPLVLGATRHSRASSRDTVGSWLPCPGVTIIPASLIPGLSSSLNQPTQASAPTSGRERLQRDSAELVKGKINPGSIRKMEVSPLPGVSCCHQQRGMEFGIKEELRVFGGAGSPWESREGGHGSPCSPCPGGCDPRGAASPAGQGLGFEG